MFYACKAFIIMWIYYISFNIVDSSFSFFSLFITPFQCRFALSTVIWKAKIYIELRCVKYKYFNSSPRWDLLHIWTACFLYLSIFILGVWWMKKRIHFSRNLNVLLNAQNWIWHGERIDLNTNNFAYKF